MEYPRIPQRLTEVLSSNDITSSSGRSKGGVDVYRNYGMGEINQIFIKISFFQCDVSANSINQKLVND